MEHPFFMSNTGNTSRAEAIRWLSIAEKLLTNRDLVGSKSFATRARESDPTLLPAEQIIAIVDTLIAGDKRINNQHLDYYSILQIPLNQTHDSELIANQYRRLALLLNPQKNNFPFSEHAFHLVVDAWSVLSNAFRRSVYDKEIGFFLNLNPVVVVSSPSSNSNPIGFMQQSSMIFQSQQQQQPQVSSVPSSSSRERQTVTFLQEPQPQQPITSFLGRNQTQPVSSTMLSPNREQQNPFTFGSSTTRGQQQQQQQVAFAESTRGQQVAFVESRRDQRQVASVEQQGNKQAAQRNEGLFGNSQNYTVSASKGVNNNEGLFGNNQDHSVNSGKNVNFGNNQNYSSSASKIVNSEGLFGNTQNQSVSASKNVSNEGLFGNNQNQSASTGRNVSNEGLFGNNQNQSASTGRNVSNEGLFGNNQNQSASTGRNVSNEGLFGNQNQSASASKIVSTESLFGNNQNQSASTGRNVSNEGLFGNNQNYPASASKNANNEGLFGNNTQNQPVSASKNVNNEGLFGNNQNRSANTSSNNVNSEGLFGNNQNHPASTTRNVNNELFGNNQNHSASTGNNVTNEGLFGNSQNHSVTTSHNNVNNEGLLGNNQNHSASISNNNVNSIRGKKRGADEPSHAVPSFWTACPYCYLMYEYPLEYVDCTLRCQKCKRAFQAVKIASPPPIIEGQEAYICCWGFMPLGFSVDIFKKYKGNISSWTPFAPINKHGGARKPSAPRVYIDDYEEDVFLGLSESSEESDDDWKGDKKTKKAKIGKRKSKRLRESKRLRRKKAKIQQSDKGKNVVGNAGDDVQDVSATQGDVEIPNVATAQSSKRGIASNTRRQAGRVAKDVGKLDLNVEFSNEVEEPPAPGMGQGNGAGTGEDGNIEGIEFFEGLDEFLSSLPILNAVGDDKVKAA
ncbi:uncharacterized protein LOC132063161 [Lycium ferocissimum]|uniref:uncharacterized protein LOC132063161 n=1 Tax=Lycium ferocissimum TaxID=112874 RepID=UPI002815CDD7|nr:uncharacterized protein LOC132063161 [Lycium ferocissimum]